MKTILYVTDLYYVAKGRNYHEEDLMVSARLKSHFNILLVHPTQALAFLDAVDIVIFRNTGPIMGFSDDFQQFKKAVHHKNIPIFNTLDGKADAMGKHYLLDLTLNNFPVIPTIDRFSQIHRLGSPKKYIVKPMDGADSIGMTLVNKDRLKDLSWKNCIVQPYVGFEHEVSLYYLNNEFQYALYAPDKAKRWELYETNPSMDDLTFANRFVEWNGMKHGITRVDACRLKDGSLLLVELEDLNPFLSLDWLSSEKRNYFLDNFVSAINDL